MHFFQATSLTVLKLAFISTASFFIFRIGFIKKYVYPVLIDYIIYIAVPCMIFSSIVRQFDIQLFKSSYFLLIYPLVILSLRFLFAKAVSKILKPDAKIKNIFIALITFNNSGYLPIALVTSIFSGIDAERAVVYIALYVVTYNLIQWSFGVQLMSKTESSGFRITPPLVAAVAGILIALSGFKQFIPEQLLNITKAVGSTSTILIMVMLGAAIAELPSLKFKTLALFKKFVGPINIILLPLIFNLIIYPIIVILVIKNFNFDIIVRTIIIIQSSTPPAVNLVLICKKYGDAAALDLVTKVMLVSYSASIITIPLMIFLAGI